MFTRIIKKIIIILIIFITANSYAKENKYKIKTEIIWQKYIDKKIGNNNPNINLEIINDVLFTASTKGEIFAIKDNKVLWKKNIKDKIKIGPSVNKKTLTVISKKNKLYTINPINGKLLFTKKILENTTYKPKITNNNIYINTYGSNLIGFNINNKKKIFQYSSITPMLGIYSGTNIIISNKSIYNIYSNGKLIVINKNNNKLLWNKIIYDNNENTDYKKINDTINDLIINKKILYMSNHNGNFAAINTENQKIIWNKNFNEPIKFILKKNNIFITTKSGKIYEINKTNGSIIWNENLKTKNLTKPIKIKKIKKYITFDKYGNIYLINKNKEIIKQKTNIKDIKKDPVKNSKDNIYTISKEGKLIYIKIYN